jgi:hypothetical protein
MMSNTNWNDGVANHISSALMDMYDIRKALSSKVKSQPKDNDGTETTIGDCIDSVIEALEYMDFRKWKEVK